MATKKSSSKAAAKGPKIPDSRLAAQLYTLRDFLKTPAEVDATFAKVKAIGYKAVQVSGLGPIDNVELRGLLEKHGLYCCATHEGMDALKNRTSEVIAKMKTLGAPFTALGSAGNEYRSVPGIATLAQDLNAVGKALAAEGLEFGYHNHKFEFQKFDGKNTMLSEIFRKTKPAFVKAEIDTYWVQYGGADPVAWILAMKGRMPVVHLKDFQIITVEGKDEVMMCEVGEGNLDFKGILAACDKAKVRWLCVEQDRCLRDPFESLAISYKNLRKLGVK